MAQAVMTPATPQYAPDALTLTEKHYDAPVEAATLPAVPETPPRAVTPTHGVKFQSVPSGADTVSEEARQIQALQRQIAEMQLQSQLALEQQRLQAEQERQRFAQQQQVLQEEVFKLQRASTQDHQAWSAQVRQHQSELKQQAQQAEQRHEAEKTHMREEFKRMTTTGYKEFTERAEEKHQATLRAAEKIRVEREELLKQQLQQQMQQQMHQQQLQFQQQQEQLRLQQDSERRQREADQQHRDAQAKRVELELERLRQQQASVQLALSTSSSSATPPPASTPAAAPPPVAYSTSVFTSAPFGTHAATPMPAVSSTVSSMSGPPVISASVSRPFGSASATSAAPVQTFQSTTVPFGYRGSVPPWHPTSSGGLGGGNGPSGSSNGFGGGRGPSRGSNGTDLPGEGNLSAASSQPVAAQSTTAKMVGFRMMMPFSSITYFKGDGPLDARKRWWNEFTYTADACMWKPEERCKYLPMWLEGSTHAWYRQLAPTDKQTWKMLSRKFYDQICTASDTAMEEYLAMTPQRGVKPLHFLWKLNAAAARAQVDTSTAKGRQKHIKKFLQKITDKALKFNLAGRSFYSMDEFEETLKMYHEVTNGAEEPDEKLYRSETPKSVQFKKQELVPGRFRPKESNPNRAYWAEESRDDYGEYDSALEEEESEEQVYAAPVSTLGPRNSFHQPTGFNNQGNRFSRGQPPPGAQSPSRIACAKCKRLGHSAEACWNDLLCEYCGERGHPSDRCFRKPLPCIVCGNTHTGGCPMFKDIVTAIQAVAASAAASKPAPSNSSSTTPTTPPRVNPSSLN